MFLAPSGANYQRAAFTLLELLAVVAPLAAPNGLGRKFVLIDFRWLGPNDL